MPEKSISFKSAASLKKTEGPNRKARRKAAALTKRAAAKKKNPGRETQFQRLVRLEQKAEKLKQEILKEMGQ